MVRRLRQRSDIDMPRIMIANITISNAFAYESLIDGRRFAPTIGLLNILETEDVEAVLGHNLGHIKHRDVQIMMFASVLTVLVYYLGFSVFRLTNYCDRNSSSGAALGSVCMIIYFILTLLSLRLTRLRVLCR